MFASIRQYRLNPDDYRLVVPRIEHDFIPAIRALDGFVSYQVTMTDVGGVMSVSTFTDRAGCQRSDTLAAALHADLIGGMMIELVDASVAEVVMFAGPLPRA